MHPPRVAMRVVWDQVPWGQAIGALLRSGQKCPAVQPLHSVAPISSVYVPPVQAAQVSLPLTLAMVPGAHARQIPDPGEKWPAGHATSTVADERDATVLLALAPSTAVSVRAPAPFTAASTSAALAASGVPAALAERALAGGAIVTPTTKLPAVA